MRVSFGLGRGLLRACLLGLLFIGHASIAQAQYFIDNASETVPGNHGSPWIVPDSGELTIGDTGTGALTINSGGIVTSTSGYIGNSAGGTGTVSVTGAGSTWNNGSLYVGNEGTGTLNIEDGAAYESNNGLYVGYDTGSTGTVTVSGDGSLLDVVSGVVIGSNGSGTLNVENGATFNAQSVVISQYDGVGTVNVSGGSAANTGTVYLGKYGSFGTMNVSGAGTTWTINGALEEGYDGDGGGAVNITAGAHVSTTGELTVGYYPSPYTSTVTVSGANSLLSVGGSAYLGYESAGTVLVSDGGHLQVSGYSYLSSDSEAPITVTVTGQGSEWTTEYMYLGEYGDATVNVLNGGHVSTTTGVTVGEYDYGQTGGALNISGAGSRFVSGGDAYIGYEGKGSVNVSNGGLFQVDGTSYLGDGNAGTVVVTGPGSVWKAQEIQAGVYYSSSYPNSRGDISVLNGGAIQATSIKLAVDYADTPGMLLVSGPGSSVMITGGLVVGDVGNGIATIANGGTVSASSVTIANQAGSTGKLIFGAASASDPVAAGSLNTSQVSFGSGTGEIDFNLLGSYAFAPELSGTGNINVFAGTTTFSTDSNSYSGQITVTGGKAVFNAALPGDVDVSGTGIVGGNGTISSLTAGSGGTVAPGNSIGQLNVTNSVTFNSGSTYAVELNAAGQSGMIYTPGTATLNGGTVKTSGTYAITTYTILTAMDGVTGTFDKLESGASGSPFLNLALSYDADNVYLNVTRGASLEDAAKTPNQRSIARALNELPGDNPLSTAMLAQKNFASARRAFDATSGEIHASLGTALADNTRYIREAINGRMIQASYGGRDAGQPIVLASTAPTDVATVDNSSRMSLGFGSEAVPRGGHDLAYWSRAFGAWSQYDSNGNAATTDRSVGGFISGIDAGMGGGWRAGVTGGYMYTGLDAAARASSANVDSYVIGAYAGGPVGAFAVRAGGTWMWNNIDTSRAVSFPGFFESEKANYDGDTGQIFGEVALPMARNGYALEPFAGLAYVHVGTDGFKENGSDAGLTSGGNNGDLGVGTLGARIGTTMMWGETMIVPHASLAWQYAFGDTVPVQTMAFNGTNVGFDVGGVPLAQNSALLEVGADMSIGLGTTLGLSYIGQYAGHEQDNGLRGRLNWKF